MNKYQEALDFLFDKAAQEYEIDEEACEVNILDCTSHDKYLKPCLKLQELVDKSKPIKVINIGKLDVDIKIGNTTFRKGTNALKKCPNCHKYVNKNYEENYCGNCGQALDWSDKHE